MLAIWPTIERPQYHHFAVYLLHCYMVLVIAVTNNRIMLWHDTVSTLYDKVLRDHKEIADLRL